jgi:putative peptidoglycan lipid II flippase
MAPTLVRNTAKVSLLTIATKAAGALKTIVIAQYFGAAGILDTYLIAYLPLSFLMDSISAPMVNALLPAYVERAQLRSRREASELQRSVAIRMLGAVTVVAAVLGLFSGPVLHLLATGFDGEKIRLTQNLLLTMLPILPLSAVNVCWRAVLNAEEHFTVAAISPAVVPFCTIAAIAALTRSYGILALSIGTLGGTVIESAWLLYSISSPGMPIAPGRSTTSPSTYAVFAQYLPAAGSGLLLNSSALIEQSMAAMLGAGSVALLNYGTRLVGVLIAVGPSAVSTVFLPWFSRLTTGHAPDRLQKSIVRYCLMSLIATVPTTLILIAGSNWLVRILFERGAFTAADTATVAAVQSYALLRLPFSVQLALLLPMIASLKRNKVILKSICLATVVSIVLNLWFMRTLGVAGLALATTIVQLLIVVILGYSCSRTSSS